MVNVVLREWAMAIHLITRLVKRMYYKPNKIKVDEGSEFYNESVKSWLNKMVLNLFNEEKFVFTERFTWVYW